MSHGIIPNNFCTTDFCVDPFCVPLAWTAINTQFEIVILGITTVHCQVNIAAYNINRLRILWEIQTDGVVANNYTASSEASADKAVINVKSDIIERYWQSTGCIYETLTFDAGPGRTIAMDTFALVGTNLTGSAIVALLGFGNGASSAPGSWSSVPIYANVTMPSDPNEANVIWISPTLPLVGYRWWQIVIQDPTNPDGFIRIGRVVGGAALIFNGENCIDNIQYNDRNYKDEQQLNGFTAVANNRALKKEMALSFRDLDSISLTNFRKFKSFTKYARDTLKSLVIVDPSNENTKYKFAVFAKLKQTPDESHTFVTETNSYVSLQQVQWDEAR